MSVEYTAFTAKKTKLLQNMLGLEGNSEKYLKEHKLHAKFFDLAVRDV